MREGWRDGERMRGNQGKNNKKDRYTGRINGENGKERQKERKLQMQSLRRRCLIGRDGGRGGGKMN